MVASVGASFAPQRGLRCCTKPQAVFGFCSFLSGFYLQIEGKRKWTRRDSNSCPPPCEGGLKVSSSFVGVSKPPYLSLILANCFRRRS
jgi:hypothetical protein